MASKKQIQTTRVGTTRTCGCVWLGNSLLVRPQTFGRATWPPRKRASNNVILRFEPSKSMETFGRSRMHGNPSTRTTKHRTTTPCGRGSVSGAGIRTPDCEPRSQGGLLRMDYGCCYCANRAKGQRHNRHSGLVFDLIIRLLCNSG